MLSDNITTVIQQYFMTILPYCTLQIPDVISSMALAKKGYYDGAMSGAIGSQVSVTLL